MQKRDKLKNIYFYFRVILKSDSFEKKVELLRRDKRVKNGQKRYGLEVDMASQF